MFDLTLKRIAFCCIKEIINNVLGKNECIILFAFCAVIEIMNLSTLHFYGTKMVWKLTFKDKQSVILWIFILWFVVVDQNAPNCMRKSLFCWKIEKISESWLNLISSGSFEWHLNKRRKRRETKTQTKTAVISVTECKVFWRETMFAWWITENIHEHLSSVEGFILL